MAGTTQQISPIRLQKSPQMKICLQGFLFIFTFSPFFAFCCKIDQTVFVGGYIELRTVKAEGWIVLNMNSFLRTPAPTPAPAKDDFDTLYDQVKSSAEEAFYNYYYVSIYPSLLPTEIII